MKYRFKAKDLKTGEWVEGDLAYVTKMVYKKEGLHTIPSVSGVEPMILTHYAHGGMIWVGYRYWVDENTIELIREE